MRTATAAVGLVLGACASRAAPPAVQPVPTPVPAVTEPAPPAAAHVHSGPWSLESLARDAELLGNLGRVQRKVTSKLPEAQAFFDQGLALSYGFNHDEAARSFARAAELDPACASCFWGVALVLGPNYNMPMLANRFPAAWTALREAQELAVHATPDEQALIAALAKRYPGPEPL